MLTVVPDPSDRDAIGEAGAGASLIDEIVREDARRGPDPDRDGVGSAIGQDAGEVGERGAVEHAAH
jgi:hypothetical protein